MRLGISPSSRYLSLLMAPGLSSILLAIAGAGPVDLFLIDPGPESGPQLGLRMEGGPILVAGSESSTSSRSELLQWAFREGRSIETYRLRLPVTSELQALAPPTATAATIADALDRAARGRLRRAARRDLLPLGAAQLELRRRPLRAMWRDLWQPMRPARSAWSHRGDPSALARWLRAEGMVARSWDEATARRRAPVRWAWPWATGALFIGLPWALLWSCGPRLRWGLVLAAVGVGGLAAGLAVAHGGWPRPQLLLLVAGVPLWGWWDRPPSGLRGGLVFLLLLGLAEQGVGVAAMLCPVPLASIVRALFRAPTDECGMRDPCSQAPSC